MWEQGLIYLGGALKMIGWAFSPLCTLPFILIILAGNKRLIEITMPIITLIEAVIYRLGEAVKWLLPCLVIIVAFTVFALSIFGQSWTKLFESAQYIHAALIMLGAAATLLADKHVRVDIWHSNMSAKARARVDLCGFYLFLLPVSVVILWNSQSFISSSWAIKEVSAETDGIAGVYLLKTLIPIFALTMMAQGLAIALRAAIFITGQDQYQTQPQTPPNIAPFFEHRPISDQTVLPPKDRG